MRGNGQLGTRSRRPVGRHIAVMLVAILMVACGGDDGGDESGSGDGAGAGGLGEQVAQQDGSGSTGEDGSGESTGGESGSDAADTLTGTWEGTYECRQGATPIELTLLDVADGAVEGFFEFTPPDAAPDAPVGNYRVTGSHSDGSLALEGRDWVNQPEGYEMVSVAADTSDRDDADQLEGTIVGAGCESFAVERVTTDPWYVGTWEGGYNCAQGTTGMTLTITGTGGNTADALYEFFPFEDNPNVPSGSYNMSGEWVDGTLQLEGTEWVERPEGYVMVPIASDPQHAIGPDRLAGAVADPSCEAFILERAQG